MKITVTFTADEIKTILANHAADMFGFEGDAWSAKFPGSYSYETLPATFDVVFDRATAE